MTSDDREVRLSEAVSHFLTSLSPEKRGASQQEIYRFARWFGWQRPLAGLTAVEVANYAEQLSTSDTDYMRKLELVRAFLNYARKRGWNKTNLAVHLKARKGKTRPQPSFRRGSPKTATMTPGGYAQLEAELATLRGKRRGAIEEIRKAAADKDFRENVPLEAAREQRGQLEGRIMELEETLRSAVVVDGRQTEKAAHGAGIGDSVILRDLDSGEEVRYTLVGAGEVDPTRGKISGASPIGRALMGKGEGATVEVAVPAGKLRYQIKQIEQSLK